MAHLRNIAIGDDDDADRYDDVAPQPEDYGVCPSCGIVHGGGFCPEPGDLIVCACGLMHEECYCPTAAGHGLVL